MRKVTKGLAGFLVLGAMLAWPACAAAKGCPSRDVRAMLADAGQGINGRVIAVHERFIRVLAESRYRPNSIRFGETVRIYGRSLPATRQGRIGIVLRRDGHRWRADRCDVVPGWRMANALAGLEPCPRPRVRVTSVRVDGLVAHVWLRLIGDVTTLRIDSGRTVRRHRFLEPGFVSILEDLVYRAAGTYRARFRVEGGFGPGCGTDVRRASSVARTIVVRSG